MNRVQVLKRIDQLEKKIKLFPQLREKYNKEIERLGKNLTLTHRTEKERAIVKKGQDMTYSELMWLHEQQEYTYDDLAHVLGMSKAQFEQYIRLHQGKIKIHINYDLENVKRLLRETDMPIEDIAEKYNMTKQAVYQHARKIRKPQSASSKGG